jgi:hypothetical protein
VEMRKIILLLCLIVLMSISACTDAERSNITTIGSAFQITLFSGGKIVGQWESSGKVLTEDKTDGYQFRDNKTSKFIRVSGNVVVEEL